MKWQKTDDTIIVRRANKTLRRGQNWTKWWVVFGCVKAYKSLQLVASGLPEYSDDTGGTPISRLPSSSSSSPGFMALYWDLVSTRHHCQSPCKSQLLEFCWSVVCMALLFYIHVHAQETHYNVDFKTSCVNRSMLSTWKLGLNIQL